MTDKTTVTPPPEINDQSSAIIGNARLSGDFAENISYRFDLGLDSLWRYYLSGEALFRFSIFKLGAGSFFHYSEKGTEILNPALIATAGIELPGLFFVEGKTIMTFFADLSDPGSIDYNYLGWSAGYWTQDLIAGFYYDSKKMEEKRTDTLLVRDSLTRYFFHAGIYDKNRMWTINLDFGYEEMVFEMTKTDVESVQTEAIFAGLEVILRISNSLSWHIKGEVPYPLDYPADVFWWTAATGFTIKLAD
ncbi:MAG: hypothetical protein LBG27_05905 [Spirochaetaceae bacterium]|nr:hypothetical protein [Spirochaetaceae bacterium]